MKKKDLRKEKKKPSVNSVAPRKSSKRDGMERALLAAGELARRPAAPLTISYPIPVYLPGAGPFEPGEMKAVPFEAQRCLVAGTGKLHLHEANETLAEFTARIRAAFPRKFIVMESPFDADLDRRTERNPFSGSSEIEAMKTLTREEMHAWRFEQMSKTF